MFVNRGKRHRVGSMAGRPVGEPARSTFGDCRRGCFAIHSIALTLLLYGCVSTGETRTVVPGIQSIPTLAGPVLVPKGDSFEVQVFDEELEWYDYQWLESRDRVIVEDFPVIIQDCFHGPGVLVPEGCQKRWDYDFDGDVDLADMAYYFANLTEFSP